MPEDEGAALFVQLHQLDLNKSSTTHEDVSHIIGTYFFSSIVQEIPVSYLITKLGTTLMIWIGSSDGALNELSYSTGTRYDKGLPSSTALLTSGDPTSSVMATKLAKKLGKPVFVSCNIKETFDGSMHQAIQTRLLREIEIQPSKF